MISHARLVDLLRYDPETGVFSWKNPPNVRFEVGDIAGSLGDDGRWHVKVDGRRYLASRLAWFYMTGVYPDVIVDHENRDKTDDRFSNLRLAVKRQNCENCGLYSNNTSGVKGVELDKRTGKWRASFRFNRKRYSLGAFIELDEATEIAIFAREFFFGKFYADLT